MLVIRAMKETDRDSVLEMMRTFYTSPAVSTDGSEEIYNNDITACVSENPFAEGFIFENGGEIAGYAMIAKSFSTEFGKHCVWIEDLYMKPEHRKTGIGTAFFRYIESRYPGTLLRLEVEKENESAVRVYESCGFDYFPYAEMKKHAEGRHC